MSKFEGQLAPDELTADVAIVGYGPVGQLLALKLAQAGHTAVVIERQTSLYGLPRAVGLDHEAMRILQSVGVMDALAPDICHSQTYEWRDREGELLVEFPGLDRPSPSDWPNGCSFHQPALERILDLRIRNDHAGQVRVLTGQSAIRLNEATHGIVVETEGAAGAQKKYSIHTRYVIGCDGAGSFVRSAIGSKIEDLGFSSNWLVVDLHPCDPADFDTRLVQVCDPSRPTTMVPGGFGRRRFEFMLLEDESKESFNTTAAAWSLLERWGWHSGNAILERHAVYTFRAAIADVWRKGRVLLAGDAAHVMPPFAAQGLCGGIRDVAALSWRLDALLRNTATDEVLESYQAERPPAIRPFIDFAMNLGRMSCLRDPQERNRALQAARAAGSKFPAPPLGRSSFTREGDPSSGTLSIQGRVRQHGRSGRFDDLVGQGFMLIGNNVDPALNLNMTQRSFLQAVGARTLGIGTRCTVQDIDGAYRRWFEQLDARAILVRPDSYIYGAGDASHIIDDLIRVWPSHGLRDPV